MYRAILRSNYEDSVILSNQAVTALENGEVVEDKGELGKGASKPHLLELNTELENFPTIEAVFKTSIPFKLINVGHWWSSFLDAEVAAYRVSQNLRFNLVPPTVFRDYHKRGVLQLYVPDAKVPSEDYVKSNDLIALDYLIRNYDRKIDNFLLLTVDGKTYEVAIDHGWAFHSYAVQEKKSKLIKHNVGGEHFTPKTHPTRFILSRQILIRMGYYYEHPGKLQLLFDGLNIKKSVINVLKTRMYEILEVNNYNMVPKSSKFNWVKSAWSWGTSSKPKDVQKLNLEIPEKISSLLVVVHGLGVHQAQFMQEVNAYQNIFHADYVIAPIYEQENAGKLEQITDQYYQEIHHLMSRVPDDGSIILIGLSNGGRIVMILANMLADLNIYIDVFTIGTPLKGSSIIKALPSGAGKKKLGVELHQELKPRTSRQRELTEIFRNLPENVVVRHVVGINDQIVMPPSRAYFPENETIFVRGVDHGHLFMAPDTLDFLREFRLEADPPLSEIIESGHYIDKQLTYIFFPDPILNIINAEESIPIPINLQLNRVRMPGQPGRFSIWHMEGKNIVVFTVKSKLSNPETLRTHILTEFQHGIDVLVDDKPSKLYL